MKPSPSRTGRKKGKKDSSAKNVASRARAARMEEYHAYFSDKFYERNPAKKYPSYKQLGIILGYSESTVKRDIRELRLGYKLPLEVIPQYGGWGYTQEVVKSPTVKFTKGQLVLICMAWKSLEGCRGTPVADQAAEAFEQLIQALGPKLCADLKKVRDRISFRATTHFAPVDPEVFEAVAAALFEDEELRFEYQKLDDGKGPKAKSGGTGRKATKPLPEQRHGQPRQLLYYDGGWYLYTDDIPSGLKRRKFMLSRIKSAHRTGVRFAPKDEFELEKELRGVGIHSSGDETIVRLRYHGMSAQLAAERTYHGMKSLTENADGTVDLVLKTVIAPELRRFVLRSGSEVEILEPTDFQREMQEEAGRMVERWRNQN